MFKTIDFKGKKMFLSLIEVELCEWNWGLIHTQNNYWKLIAKWINKTVVETKLKINCNYAAIKIMKWKKK